MRSRREFLKIGTMGTILGCNPLLLQAANNPYLAGGNSKTFLKACAKGDTAKVKRLLAADPDLLTTSDGLGRTGFALALLGGMRETATYLKAAGYQTDLHEAALDLDWERFETLTAEETEEIITQVNSDHPIGGSAMWAAAAGGAGSAIWRVYAKCGYPDGNPRKEKGATPLQKALRFSDLPTAELTAATLLGNDTDPNPAPNADLPPLHIAAERGSLEMVEMLIRLGADVDRRDHKGRTAARLAESKGHEAVWQLLQQHQQLARTCRTSRAAYTAEGQRYRLPELQEIPLFDRSHLVGLSHFNIEQVQKEIAADPRLAHSVATTGEKAVEAAAHMGRKDLVEALLQKGAPYSLPTAVMLNDFTSVKRLLDEDPDRIHERGAHDFALLWYPIIGKCELDMTQLLLDRGARVEEQHYLGTTALHWACMRGPIELVELLLENGADINRPGRKFSAEGQRPLDLVKDESIKSFLRSKGAE
ncbi:MAG: ankyrin repeat domain-containing protein [Saprospiraceae bacterium]|nr:ankyrin repeat domain-containing protein [Lewinella sp.]